MRYLGPQKVAVGDIHIYCELSHIQPVEGKASQDIQTYRYQWGWDDQQGVA